MAATGKTPILLYGSTTATHAPVAGNLTNSSDGCEIAINVADKNLFFKDSTNTVNTVPIRQSSASSNGWLSSTDWTAFNSKVSSQWTTSGSYIYYNTGNVGIGTAAPTVASGLGLVLNGGAGQTRLAFKNSTTGDADGDGVQLVLVSTGFIYQNRETGGYHSFEINGVEYLQVASTGNINVPSGNVVIGTSGKGIDFSATPGTGTSELLADYEEGTWTPVLNGFTGTASKVGYYTKIGRAVYVWGRLIPTTTLASAVASSYISGLPYAPYIDGQVVNWVTAYTGQASSINVGSNLYTPTVAAYGGAFYFSIVYFV